MLGSPNNMAARSFISSASPRPSLRSRSHGEAAGFAESETRLKQASRQPEDIDADIQASLLAAFDELDQLDSQLQTALPSNQPARPPALPRGVPRLPGASKLPAHMPPLPASEPRIFVAKRKLTPPPLPLSALALAAAPVLASAPVSTSAAAPGMSSARLSPAGRSSGIARLMWVLCALFAVAAVALASWPGLRAVRLESVKPAWFALLRLL